ncbi:hypothetical protein M0802_012173 [Mischocyttarus mexicanus]|nr:hypothetical protein M0802_012173 [Mischocyttarus mexicanus]
MLAAFIRCAFLVGILGWYSMNVWKMIDGYFRDQFASYLKEEYKKNPRMRSDVNNVNVKDQKDTHVIDGNVLIEKLEELKRQETCNIDKVDPEQMVESCEERVEISKLIIDRPNEILQSKETLEIILTEEKIEEEIIEEQKLEQNNEEKVMSMIKNDPKDENKNIIENKLEKKLPKKKKLLSKKEEEEIEEMENKEKSKKGRKKKRVKTITLKDEDFVSVKKKQRGTIGQDEDFWEFEEDDEEGGGVGGGGSRGREEVKGIRVADLPFKPKLDIGRLERITADEYCPLTLEDELSCDETTEWSLK